MHILFSFSDNRIIWRHVQKYGWLVGWLVVLGLTALWDNISVYKNNSALTFHLDRAIHSTKILKYNITCIKRQVAKLT